MTPRFGGRRESRHHAPSRENPNRTVSTRILLGPYVVAGRNCRVQRCFSGCAAEIGPHVHVSAEVPSCVRELPSSREIVGISLEFGWEFRDSGPPLQPCLHSVGLRLDVYDDDREPDDPGARLAVCTACHPATLEES